ncbi:hypothetical protein FKM82_001287 [Ascaphus truei]
MFRDNLGKRCTFHMQISYSQLQNAFNTLKYCIHYQLKDNILYVTNKETYISRSGRTEAMLYTHYWCLHALKQ